MSTGGETIKVADLPENVDVYMIVDYEGKTVSLVQVDPVNVWNSNTEVIRVIENYAPPS